MVSAGSTVQTSTPNLTSRLIISCCFPTVGKNHIRAHNLALPSLKVICWVVVEVSTQAACCILVGVWHTDPDIMICVVGNDQAKASTDDHRKTRLVNLDVSIAEGKRSGYKASINLHRGT